MRKRKPWKFIFILLFAVAISLGVYVYQQQYEPDDLFVKVGEGILDNAPEIFSGEPKEVQELRKQEVADTDTQGLRQEYYFSQLNEEEQRGYREIIEGIRAKEKEFYLTIYEDDTVNKVYHAVLMDHPELFWVHNRKQVYKTTFSNANYCMFSPGYSYTDEEIREIQAAADNACQEVSALVSEEADDYEKAKAVYTYLIDTAEYQESEDDQSMAGLFWRRQAVCAGYAGAVQYLLERLGVTCIYVEGDAKNSTQGHAWNIVRLDGQYYYVDATNGDQPDFLEGDAASLAEHKTTIYDYLCPFPQEYEANYTASDELEVPACTATDKNFYVMNGACFDSYDRNSIYDLCRLRIDNNAAVVRFKFSTQEAYEAAYADLIVDGGIQEIARYYMSVHGLSQISYHYGVLDHMKTMYYIF